MGNYIRRTKKLKPSKQLLLSTFCETGTGNCIANAEENRQRYTQLLKQEVQKVTLRLRVQPTEVLYSLK